MLAAGVEAEALAGRDGSPRVEEEEGGTGGRLVWILSFYIVLAQTLCTHDALKEQQTRNQNFGFITRKSANIFLKNDKI